MDYFSGQLGDRSGSDVRTAEIRFTGQLGPSFICFALARGRRLSLSGSIRDEGDAIVVEVAGPAALIDAFEITCSLGPIDSRIDSWVRTDSARRGPSPEADLRF